MKSEKQFSNQGMSLGEARSASQGNMSTPDYLLNALSEQTFSNDSVFQFMESLPPGQIVRYFAQNGLDALFQQQDNAQDDDNEDSFGLDAVALELDSALDASIEAGMENDLYSIELEEGVNYSFNVTSDELSSPYLVLRDSNGERISSDFQEEGEDSTVVNFTAPASGTFYLDLSDLEDDASGTYNISVSTQTEDESSEDSDVDAGEETDVEDNSEEETTDPVVDEEADSEDDTANQDGSDVISGEDTSSEENPDEEGTTDPVVDEEAESDAEEEATAEEDSTNQDGSDAIIDENTETEQSEQTEDEASSQDESEAVSEDETEDNSESETTEEDVTETEPTDETDSSEEETLVDDYAADTTTAGAIAANAEVQGSIEQANDSDWFAMEFEADTEYTMTFSSENAETPAMVLRDANGETVENNFNITGDDVEISFTAEEAGSYFLDVSDLSGAASGDYTLSVATDAEDVIELPELNEDDISSDILTTSFLEVGDSVESSLDFAGDSDWFATSLEAGVTYDVSLESDTLESGQLSVMDSSGELAFSLDDADEDGILSFTAEESGTYFIAASDANPDATGDYLIGVQQQTETDVIA